MRARDVARGVISVACGVVGSLALAIGFALTVLWSFDSSSSGTLPELVGGGVGVGLGVLCIVVRRRLSSTASVPSSHGEPAVSSPSVTSTSGRT